MTRATATAADASQVLNFSCQWSAGYLVSNEDNSGDLELTATTADEPVPVSKGQQLVFLDLPARWSISPRSSDWVASTFPYRGTDLPALTYVGYGESLSSFVHLLPRNEGDRHSSIMDDVEPLQIPVLVDVPDGAPNMVRVHLQLFGPTGPISNPSSVLLTTVEPNAPYVAFASPPGVVLITDPTAIALPNALDVTLLSLQASAGSNVPATLTLEAFDTNQQPVPITSALNTVQVSGGGANWVYTAANNSWAATLATIPAQGVMDIAIRELELNQATIALLAVTLTLGTPGVTYQTIAWFEAYGPFTMEVQLSASVDDSKFYRLTETSGSTYAVNALNKFKNSPPLQPDLLDANDNIVYPPVPGWYSWTTTSRDFPSDYALADGTNTIYYLINAGGTLMPLTTATVDYNFSPNEIYASGYQQGYGDPNQGQFGPIMPAGAIILWSGSVAQVPPGWALCDGSQGTPDLQSRFVVGAGASELPNSCGDATTHNHNFDFSGSFGTSTDGVHGHGFPSTWYNRELSCGVHSGIDTLNGDVTTARVQDDGAHSHTTTVSINQNTADVIAPRPAWYALCYIMKL